MKKTVCIFLFVCVANLMAAQSLHDTLSINKVDIVSNKNYSHFFETRIDSLTLAQYKTTNLGELLNTYNGIFIKSFGAGSIGSVSSHGTTSNHSTVYWNGISISNSLHGSSDVALIPTTVADDISLSQSNAVGGHVAMGLSVLLNCQPTFSQPAFVSFTMSLASFNNYKYYLQAGTASRRHCISVKPFYERGENNFTYYNRSKQGHPNETQANNALWQKGVVADYAFRISKSRLLTAHAWLQKSYRENPPTMTMENSTAYQEDNVYRYLLSYEQQIGKSDLNIKSAWLDESINYYDTLIGLTSPSRIQSWMVNASAKYTLHKNLNGESGINNSHYFVAVKEYKQQRQQNRSSVFSTVNWNNNSSTLLMNVAVSQDVMEEDFTPVNFSWSGKVKFAKDFFTSVQLAKTSRQPTLNDLYWVPGGNRNLLPESGYCFNAEINYSKYKGKFSYTCSASAFSKNISNWIQWLPGSSGYWQPQNIYNVWTRGVDATIHTGYAKDRIKIQLTMGANYTRATRNEKNEPELNKRQLMYVPEFSGLANLLFTYHHTTLLSSLLYKGARYTTSDNKNFLDDVAVINSSLQQKFTFQKKFVFSLRLGVNNFFNKRFENILYRPSPGRNYELTLSIKLNK